MDDIVLGGAVLCQIVLGRVLKAVDDACTSQGAVELFTVLRVDDAHWNAPASVVERACKVMSRRRVRCRRWHGGTQSSEPGCRTGPALGSGSCLDRPTGSAPAQDPRPGSGPEWGMRSDQRAERRMCPASRRGRSSGTFRGSNRIDPTIDNVRERKRQHGYQVSKAEAALGLDGFPVRSTE